MSDRRRHPGIPPYRCCFRAFLLCIYTADRTKRHLIRPSVRTRHPSRVEGSGPAQRYALPWKRGLFSVPIWVRAADRRKVRGTEIRPRSQGGAGAYPGWTGDGTSSESDKQHQFFHRKAIMKWMKAGISRVKIPGICLLSLLFRSVSGSTGFVTLYLHRDRVVGRNRVFIICVLYSCIYLRCHQRLVYLFY